MNENNKYFSVQWLRILFYLSFACFALSLLDFLPIDNGLIDWPKRVLTACMIYCLFQMSNVLPRYRKAAIFRAVQLVCILLGALISFIWIHWAGLVHSTTMGFLRQSASFVVLIVSYIATYQIYNSHGDLVADFDPALAQKWRQLFPITIVASILTSLGSLIVAMLQVTQNVGGAVMISSVQTIIMIPHVVIELVSLIYLRRTLKIFEGKEE